MRRGLAATVLFLLMFTAAQADAGYIILRVLIENGDIEGPKDGGIGVPPMGSPPEPSRFNPRLPVRPIIGEQPGDIPNMPVKSKPDPSQGIVVVIPYDKKFDDGKGIDPDPNKPIGKNNPKSYHVTVPYYGSKLRASLFIDSTSILLYKDFSTGGLSALETRTTEMRDKYARWNRDKKDPQELFDTLILALKSGIINDRGLGKDNKPAPDAMKIAQEILKLTPEQKAMLAGEAKQFVTAWEKMSKDVQQPSPRSTEAAKWKAVMNATGVKQNGHYALVYWQGTDSADVDRRLMQLNDNFDAFFLWHATRGITLSVPEKPLLAVLANNKDDMPALLSSLDGLAPNSDAFYAPDHDLVVLAPAPVDDYIANSFLRQNQQLRHKHDFNQLLNGKVPALDHEGKKGSKPHDVSRANTLALIERMMLEETELAAVSYEGTRQLMFASGVLPRHVTLPNWLSNGALNTFNRPRGPAYITTGDDEKPYMSIALSTGYGVPNYVLHRYLTEMADSHHKELNPDSVKLLENVIKDAYFNAIRDGEDPDPAPPPKKIKKKPEDKTAVQPQPQLPPLPTTLPPGEDGRPGAQPLPLPNGGTNESVVVSLQKKQARLNIKANATAWSLYYYLANARPNELRAYVAELNKLPRDLPIDGHTAYDAFVRSFNLAAAKDGSADPERMKRFANDWISFIQTIPKGSIDIDLESAAKTKPVVEDPMNPMTPKELPGRGP